MVLRRLAQIADRGIRRAAAFPVDCLTVRSRARAVERLSERMLTTIETNRGPIRFFCPSPLLTSRAESLLTKEPDTIRWINTFDENTVFWDVGANVGVFSLYAAINRGVSVLSFEPLAANFYVLSRNIQINNLADQITAYCLALSGFTDLGLLNIVSPQMGSALTHFGEAGEMSPYCVDGTKGYAQGMIAFSLDDFIKQFRCRFPNYIKLDVDGLESSILQGAQNTLCDRRLQSIMVELSLSKDNERVIAISFLEGFGFELKSVGEGQGTDAGVGANHLFVRGKR